MQLTFFKNAPSSLQSVKDTGQQQRRSRKNSSATLWAYKRRLPSSKQLAWTSEEANKKKKKKTWEQTASERSKWRAAVQSGARRHELTLKTTAERRRQERKEKGPATTGTCHHPLSPLQQSLPGTDWPHQPSAYSQELTSSTPKERMMRWSSSHPTDEQQNTFL